SLRGLIARLARPETGKARFLAAIWPGCLEHRVAGVTIGPGHEKTPDPLSRDGPAAQLSSGVRDDRRFEAVEPPAATGARRRGGRPGRAADPARGPAAPPGRLPPGPAAPGAH